MSTMKTTLRLCFILSFLIMATPISANRPKVGLALGGGGAKGAATIGVLKVIEFAGVKVDYIAGTSIGAIIGGLYASGYTPAELETLFVSQEWQDIVEGHRVEAKLKYLLAKYGVDQFEDTRIPFRCVAAEENSFEEVVLSKGPLYKAILASMSVPEIYEPVKWENMYLVDGGVINNLPVDVVKDMGADIVIAVDLQQKSSIEFGITLGIGGLVDWALNRPDQKKRVQNIKDADVYIHPQLPNYSAFSFSHDDCKQMIQFGERAALEHFDELLEIKNRQLYLHNSSYFKNRLGF